LSVLDVVVCKIICSKLERSAAFYERLGFQPLAAPNATTGSVVPQLYGVAATGLRSQMLARPDNTKAVRRDGVGFVSPPASFRGSAGTTWNVRLRDPDGFNVQLVQFVKKQA
jgi:hypothetical protein